ncbi:GNAT family N-acetyltransferase [Lentilactobacillus sp. Marseille-Q4993]|uniref:GNAT family N-acetyltransferase n=1 Tax=Lentilactobacillus sp. Marseille-Q4993 TaxID=3039492 RepID=UPI0024BC1E7D|nr:GNAT family N-acetyltransferase [Lentilactobacillus sp. Marseille-Q4993]
METITIDSNTANLSKYTELISSVSWKAGKYLAKLLMTGELTGYQKAFVILDNNQLVGFSALLKEDIVKGTGVEPFISTVFVSEDYRGRHISQRLVVLAEKQASQAGFHTIYIATGHTGLYEKIGYQQFDEQPDQFGRTMRLLKKDIH